MIESQFSQADANRKSGRKSSEKWNVDKTSTVLDELKTISK